MPEVHVALSMCLLSSQICFLGMFQRIPGALASGHMILFVVIFGGATMLMGRQVVQFGGPLMILAMRTVVIARRHQIFSTICPDLLWASLAIS